MLKHFPYSVYAYIGSRGIRLQSGTSDFAKAFTVFTSAVNSEVYTRVTMFKTTEVTLENDLGIYFDWKERIL